VSHYGHPTKQFLGMVPGGKFEHYNNPVLRWMASNLRIVRDHNENPMPSKRKSTARIDGISAALMALGLALDLPEADGLTGSDALMVI
jgi:phage terminase large subunit-like protein